MTIKYTNIKPGCFRFNNNFPIGEIKKLTFNIDFLPNQTAEMNYGEVTGTIFKDIIWHVTNEKGEYILHDPQKTSEPRKVLAKDDIDNMFKNLTIEVIATKKYVPETNKPEKVELVIENLKTRDKELNTTIGYNNGYQFKDYSFMGTILSVKKLEDKKTKFGARAYYRNSPDTVKEKLS